jgi:heme-degrading monooxygenase HmoA
VFGSIRRYRLADAPVGELAKRVDEGFAEEIRGRPGFVSYELIDCGDDEVVTISMFREHREAEASRKLAQRWTEVNLADLELRRIDARRGEVIVSRGVDEMLKAVHAEAMGKFASVRRYALRSGDVSELVHTIDRVFADQISAMDGFEAHHALHCGRGEIVSIGLFRDQSAAEESDEHALEFIDRHRCEFDLERTEVIGGEVCVSRVLPELLEPAHA